MTSNASTPEQAHPIAAPSQAVIWACPVGFGLLLSFNVMPVSYTHLDVYKRQPLIGGPIDQQE